MDVKDRQRIQKNYDFLVNEMSVVVDEVLDYFMSQGVLNVSLKKAINKSAHPSEKVKRCRIFVDMFLEKNTKLKKAHTAFGVLCGALDHCQSSHISAALLNASVEDVTSADEEESEDEHNNGASGDAQVNPVYIINNSSHFHIGNKSTYNIHHSSSPPSKGRPSSREYK